MKNGHIQWEMYVNIPYMDPMGCYSCGAVGVAVVGAVVMICHGCGIDWWHL